MGTTTTDLINSIKRNGSYPTANDLFSSSDLLEILNDEMMTHVVPLLSRIREGYFLDYKDHLIISGTEGYRIPKRAIGSSLRSIQLISSTGAIESLIHLYEEDKTSLTSGPKGYYLKSNQVLLSPVPTVSTETLRLAYFRRPSKFVLTTACAQVTNISGTTITVSSTPSTFTNGTLVDFVQGDSPYDLLKMDISITSISGTTIVMSSVPADLAIGDYLAIAGQTCTPMVPEELIPILVQAALCRCHTAKKDKSAEIEIQKLEKMKQITLAPCFRKDVVRAEPENYGGRV